MLWDGMGCKSSSTMQRDSWPLLRGCVSGRPNRPAGQADAGWVDCAERRGPVQLGCAAPLWVASEHAQQQAQPSPLASTRQRSRSRLWRHSQHSLCAGRAQQAVESISRAVIAVEAACLVMVAGLQQVEKLEF